MTAESPKITALTPIQASKILSAAFSRRITEAQVRQVAEDGQLLRADGTLNLIEYTAFLAGEVTTPSPRHGARLRVKLRTCEQRLHGHQYATP